MDACFSEAWQLSISFDSLNDSSTCLLNPWVCLHKQGLLLLLANQALYLILPRMMHVKMSTVSEGTLKILSALQMTNPQMSG